MPTPIQLRTAILEGIKAKIPGLPTCQPYHGEFDAEEFGRIIQPMPAVFVACLGMPRVTPRAGGSGASADVRWAAFVVSVGTCADLRDNDALAVVTPLLQIIPANHWGQEDIHNPADIRAENLYAGELDAKAVSIWSVSWTQSIEIPGLTAGNVAPFLIASTTILDASGEDPLIEGKVTLAGPA